MSYRYPYGNTEQMNLDWFLNQWEKFKADWAEAEAGIDGSLDAEIAKVEAAMSELYAARDAAAASATAARQSSLDAAAAQVAAGNSKTAAQAAETAARGSQTAAAQSAQEAQASAQGAENSALTASQAANTATQQAAGADAAKGAAEAAQQAAEDAQAAAAQSAGQAGQAATAAGDHADDAADSATLAQQAAQDMSDSVAQITTNKNDISVLKESIILEEVNIIDSSKYNSTNNAVIYNGDGTYTIGTTDYGTTIFNNNKPLALQIGTYELYGVSNGTAFISPNASYNQETAIAFNDSNSPKTVIISEPVMAYVGFRIAPKPTSSFIITPFLKKTINTKTEIADIKQEIGYISEYTYNLAKFKNEKYTTLNVLVELNEKGEAKFSGTANNSGTGGIRYKELTLAPGTYQIRATADSVTAPITRVYASSDGTLLASAGNTFSLENSTDIYIAFAFINGTTYSTTVYVMLAPANVPSEIVPAVSAVDAIARQKINGMSNFLDGKKLYCGGDSMTAADGVGTFPNGYKKSYAGYVATRNNMVYVSDGVGGSTMGVCNVDGQMLNNFVTSRYLSIPTDADFITLWFGWNDNAYGWHSARDAYCVTQYGTYYEALTSEQQATVDEYKTWKQWMEVYAGTKDSIETTTWGGAWNTVLTWLLNNCPNARIGIVIAYGVSDELNDVLIEICEKYGVSYIKAYDPHEFFSVGHSKGIGTDQATKRKALYTLDNTHPNELGYEMMSTYYEQFLRTI